MGDRYRLVDDDELAYDEEAADNSKPATNEKDTTYTGHSSSGFTSFGDINTFNTPGESSVTSNSHSREKPRESRKNPLKHFTFKVQKTKLGQIGESLSIDEVTTDESTGKCKIVPYSSLVEDADDDTNGGAFSSQFSSENSQVRTVQPFSEEKILQNAQLLRLGMPNDVIQTRGSYKWRPQQPPSFIGCAILALLVNPLLGILAMYFSSTSTLLLEMLAK